MSQDFYSIYIYMGLVGFITLALLCASTLFPAYKGNAVKYLPYESGIQTETHLLEKRFPLHHALVALLFLIFDIEVIFLFPWAAIGRTLGSFAFFEIFIFIVFLSIAFAYAWRKGGLEWE